MSGLQIVSPCARKRIAIVLALGVVLLCAACGPGSIGVGIDSLNDDGSGDRVYVIVYVNEGDEPVSIEITGESARDGSVLEPEYIVVPPGGITRVRMDRARFYRVRACEMLEPDASRAPVEWDFSVDDPADTTNLSFDLESVIFASRTSARAGGEELELHRLDNDATETAFFFTELSRTDLGFPVDRVALHPSGAYVYALTDEGNQRVTVTALRIDAATREIQTIQPELESRPDNPLGIGIAGSFADLEVAIDPLGRFLYVLDRDLERFHTAVRVLRVEADGSLSPTLSFVRDLITTLRFRANGDVAYIYEDNGARDEDGNVIGSAFRSFYIDESSGAFGFQTGEADVSCLNNESPVLAVHPSGDFAYVTIQDEIDGTDAVRVGSFFTGSDGSLIRVQALCDQFESIFDLSIDPAGAFLYVTGIEAGGAERVIRYPIDTESGMLGQRNSDQDLGMLSNITSGRNPALAPQSPFRDIVYLALGDTFVPHGREHDSGELVAIPGDPRLPFGSPASTRLISETLVGSVQIERE